MINNIKVTQLNNDGKPLVSSYTEDGRQYIPPSIQLVNEVDASGNPVSSGNIVTEKSPFGLSVSASSPRTILERFSDTVNALDYGVSTENADNATELQAAIDDAIQRGATLYIPAGLYNFTPPLNISGKLNIRGDGCFPLWGDYSKDSNSTNIPTVAPYFAGTVLSAVSNGKSIFVDTGSTQLFFSGQDFACTFQTPFANTGHMLDVSSTSKMGLMGSSWRNVGLFGHDGDHYMFNLTNILYNLFENCMSFGGGMISSVTTLFNGGCGNSTWIRTLSIVMVKGTADCYYFDATGDGLSQQYNVLIGTQGMTYDASSTFKTATPPTTQNIINCNNNCNDFTILNPDFENHSGNGLTRLPRNTTFLDRSAGSLTNLTWNNGSPDMSPDFLQRGSVFMSGSFEATSTSGTVSFPGQFNYQFPHVVLTGTTGVSPELSESPGINGFSYTVAKPGTVFWMAHGY